MNTRNDTQSDDLARNIRQLIQDIRIIIEKVDAFNLSFQISGQTQRPTERTTTPTRKGTQDDQ